MADYINGENPKSVSDNSSSIPHPQLSPSESSATTSQSQSSRSRTVKPKLAKPDTTTESVVKSQLIQDPVTHPEGLNPSLDFSSRPPSTSFPIQSQPGFPTQLDSSLAQDPAYFLTPKPSQSLPPQQPQQQQPSLQQSTIQVPVPLQAPLVQYTSSQPPQSSQYSVYQGIDLQQEPGSLQSTPSVYQTQQLHYPPPAQSPVPEVKAKVPPQILQAQKSSMQATPSSSISSASPTTAATTMSGNPIHQQFSRNYDYQYKQQPVLPQIGPVNQHYNQQYYVPNAQTTPSAATAVPAAGAPPMVNLNVNSTPPTVPQGATGRFTPQEIQTLMQLLSTGEKYKWKQITKEINSITSNKTPDGHGSDTSKNISPTFVIKQYQSLLGLPNNQAYFGFLGSSLPYVVHGWDAVDEVD